MICTFTDGSFNKLKQEYPKLTKEYADSLLRIGQVHERRVFSDLPAPLFNGIKETYFVLVLPFYDDEYDLPIEIRLYSDDEGVIYNLHFEEGDEGYVKPETDSERLKKVRNYINEELNKLKESSRDLEEFLESSRISDLSEEVVNELKLQLKIWNIEIFTLINVQIKT